MARRLDQLPDDTLRKVLSFSPNQARAVNHRMNSVRIERENIEAMRSYRAIEDEHGHNRKTWIIHKGRKHLNQIEEQYGYKGPLNRIESAVKVCESGSRLIVHSGTYPIRSVISIDKDIQIIGLGKDVTICVEDGCSVQTMFTIISGSIYFENIEFRIKQFVETMRKGHKAYHPVNALQMFEGDVRVINCRFIATKSIGKAVSINYALYQRYTSRRSMTIQDSTFRGFGTDDVENDYPTIILILRLYVDEIQADGTIEKHPTIDFSNNILIGCGAKTKIVLISTREIGNTDELTEEEMKRAARRMDLSSYSVHDNINQDEASGVCVVGVI